MGTRSIPAKSAVDNLVLAAHALVCQGETMSDVAALDDEVLEGALRAALRDGDQERAEVLRAEARRRFAGMHGLPASMMEG